MTLAKIILKLMFIGIIWGILPHSIAFAKPSGNTETKYTNTSDLTNTKQLQRVGEFRVIYQPSNKPEYQELQSALQKSRLFDGIAKGLNESNLVLRYDVPIVLRDCGQVNAFYSPKDHTITVCHEFILSAFNDFRKVFKYSEEEAAEASLYATIFVLFHELGHGLIDILDLPTVGQEEDAVDEFAAIMFLNTNTSDKDDTDKVVLYGAFWFNSHPEGVFWDEHPPGDKRFFNLMCLIYGSNPKKYTPVMEKIFTQIINNENVRPDDLQRRAQLCEKEYPKKLASWTRLLLPHFAQGSGGWGDSNGNATPPPPVDNSGGNGRVW